MSDSEFNPDDERRDTGRRIVTTEPAVALGEFGSLAFDAIRAKEQEIKRLRAENERLRRELDLADLRLDSVERAGFLAR